MEKLRPHFPDVLGVIMNAFDQKGLIAEGSTVPTNGTNGFHEGALFFKRGGTLGTQLYVNEGTNTSCTFNPFSLNGVDLSTLVATAAELNRWNHPATRLIASGASLTITQALHDGKTIVLAAAAAITLPVMSGSGSRFRFVMGATAAHLFGTILMNTDSAFQAGTLFTVGAAVSTGGSTVITFDGSTKGGNKGDWIEIEDVAAGIGAVKGVLNASGTEASPYS